MGVAIRLLGGVGAEFDGRPAALGHTRQQHVFAALAIDVNGVVPVDELVERVWGGRPPQRATGTLQSYITRLRNALPELAIVRRSGGYVLLVADPLVVDVHLFEHQVGRARTATSPAWPPVSAWPPPTAATARSPASAWSSSHSSW